MVLILMALSFLQATGGGPAKSSSVPSNCDPKTLVCQAVNETVVAQPMPSIFSTNYYLRHSPIKGVTCTINGVKQIVGESYMNVGVVIYSQWKVPGTVAICSYQYLLGR